MTDLTKIEVPFGQLDRETKIALFLAWLDGGEIQSLSRQTDWVGTSHPSWVALCRYRLKPEPVTPDSIDWGHVADRFICMARDRNGHAILCSNAVAHENGQWVIADALADIEIADAVAFASYRRGTCDWSDSLVWRPGYGAKGE